MPGPVDSSLESLRSALAKAYAADPNRHLVLGSQVLTGGASCLVDLFQQQLGVSSIELTDSVEIPDAVTDHELTVTGTAGALSLTLTVQDVQGDLAVACRFEAGRIPDLIAPFRGLDATLFSSLTWPSGDQSGQAPAVAVPGLPGPLTFTGARFALACFVLPNAGIAQMGVVPQVRGQAVVGQGTSSLALTVDLATAANGWKVAMTEVVQGSFADLDLLLPSLGLVTLLPSPLNELDRLALKKFSIARDPLLSDFDALFLVVENKDHPDQSLWPILPGVVELTEVGINLGLDFGDTGTVSLSGSGFVVGSFLLNGSLPVDVQIPIPLTEGAWVLNSTPDLELPDLGQIAALVTGGGDTLKQTLPPGVSELGGLTLSSLSLAVDPTGPTLAGFSCGLESTAAWPVIPGGRLTLSNLQIFFRIDNPKGSSPGVSGNVSGRFQIGAEEVYAKVFRYDANQPWALIVGSPTIPLPNLRDLAGLAGVSGDDLAGGVEAADLPDQRFILRDLELALQFGQQPLLQRLGFTLTLDDPQNSSGPIPAWTVIPDVLVLNDFQVRFQVDGTSTPVGVSATGHFGVGSLAFDLAFGRGANADAFVATCLVASPSRATNLRELVADLSASIAPVIPQSLQVDLKDSIVAYLKGSSGPQFLFAIDVGASFALSNLPLIGGKFSPEQTAGMQNLQLAIASQPFAPSQVTEINAMLPAGDVTRLPTAPSADDTNPAPPALTEGLSLIATLQFGSDTRPLSLPVASPANGQDSGAPALVPSVKAANAQTTPKTDQAPTTGFAAADGAIWYRLQKSIGPISFERIGVMYKDSSLLFLLDASLSFAGLTLSLDGLSIGSPLSPFAPTFDLKGIGVDYSTGPIEIGGSFLRSQATDPIAKTTYDAYNGVAVIRTAELTLSALGSYVEIGGYPSLFLYAVLDYPLGGPAFFFVTGLTAGFGYNRALIVPSIEQVAQFPLITAAMSKTPTPSNADGFTKILNDLLVYVPPQTGSLFFAIGIKFTSFKMIDAFALLAVAFGDPFEVDVLGLATLVAPTPIPGSSTTEVTPLAVVQMAIKASFIPEQGFLGVSAQLTSASYLFSQKCKLTGGFAFYSWFSGDHQGDFVLSVGGYHADFHVPDHYPTVPRVGLTWQVDDRLNIKGDCYYALTAAHLMAGGHLQLNYASDNLKAWFIAGADFLVAWQPFHYDALMRVDVGATYKFNRFGTHTMNIDVSAVLHLWGPDFSGTATIDLDVISFDVAFGPSRPQTPKAITWTQFKQAFLPDDSAVCGIALTNGLLRKNAPDSSTNAGPSDSAPTDVDLGAVDPKTLVLVVSSVIPSNKAAFSNNAPIAGTTIVPFGIGPMDIQANQLTSALVLEISRGGVSVEVDFVFVPVVKDVPIGLWGQALQPELNGPLFVEGTLAGFEIRPVAPAEPNDSKTQPLDQAELTTTDSTATDHPFAWDEGALAFKDDKRDDQDRTIAIRESLIDPATVAARKRILSALGVDSDDVNLDSQSVADLTNGFLAAPVIETA